MSRTGDQVGARSGFALTRGRAGREAAGELRLRDQRKPGHGWFDNEIYTVFGDDLGQNGISVYMTLAQLCYGETVRRQDGTPYGLRDLAAHARMSKDTFARALKRVVELGLVIERLGGTPQSPRSYDLVDVKELAQAYLRRALQRQAQATRESVSGGDSGAGLTLVEIVCARADAKKNAKAAGNPAECLMVRHMDAEEDAEEKKNCAEGFETHVSQTEGDFETHVSHHKDTFNKTQDSRLKTSTTPLPPSGARGERGVSEWEAAERVMGACDASGRRVRMAVTAAIRTALGKAEAEGRAVTALQVAEQMCEAWGEWVRAAGEMRHTLGPVKFFGEGWWADRRRWPVVRQRQCGSARAQLGAAGSEEEQAAAQARREREDGEAREAALDYWRLTREKGLPSYAREAPRWVKEILEEQKETGGQG